MSETCTAGGFYYQCPLGSSFTDDETGEDLASDAGATRKEIEDVRSALDGLQYTATAATQFGDLQAAAESAVKGALSTPASWSAVVVGSQPDEDGGWEADETSIYVYPTRGGKIVGYSSNGSFHGAGASSERLPGAMP